MKMRKTAGIAFAVAAAVVVGVFAYSAFGDRSEDNSGEIRVFKSYGQIERALRDIHDEPVLYTDGVIEDVAEAPTNAMAAKEDSAAGGQHSDTYLQVEGVDEADIIKTDGEYIFYTSRMGYDVIIAKASKGEVEEVAVISEEELKIAADDLHLMDGRLVVIGTETDTSRSVYDYSRSPSTAVCVYDVTKPEKPEPVGRYKQSGFFLSSRISGGYLYIVTADHLWADEKRIVPMAGCGDEYKKLKPEQICCFPEPASRAYVVTGSLKIDAPADRMKTRTRAVLGASDEIYCSGDSIYYTDCRADYRNFDTEDFNERTYIMKADIGKGRIAFTKQGSVRGHVLNQFSMDEKDGYFRIATTAQVKGKDVNYLYVLDKNLKTAGKVKGFAGGEQIKAVRFLGDTAYVITYEQTDPLFVIDLKDPKAPELLGSVEITGFSSLLVPDGENQLIGIGSSTSEEEFGEVEDGVKIALFDISDPMNPEVLDSMTYRDWSSDVQYNHRALTVNEEEGWYAIPYMIWEDETGGVLQFKAEGGKLMEMNRYESKEGIDRCLYIDDYIYGLEQNEDNIISWEIIQRKERH